MEPQTPGQRETAGESPRPAQPDVAGSRPPPHPLGPLVRMVPLQTRVGGRLVAGSVTLAAAVLLVVAGMLRPDRSGKGTHEQIGLAPCGFPVMTGLPCPTCGMTTAFSHFAHGHVVQAARAQAFGFLLAVGVAATLVGGLAAVITGRRPTVNWYRMNPVTVIWVGTLLFVAAWGLKMVLYLTR